MNLSDEQLDHLASVIDGATIWGLGEARIYRSIQSVDPELLQFVGLAELEVITGQEYDGAKQLPYFGVIATKKGKELVKKSINVA